MRRCGSGLDPEFGDKHGRGVVAEPGADIAIEPLKPLAQSLEILASIAYAGLMGRSVLAANRDRGGVDQLPRQFLAYAVAAIIAQPGQAFVGEAAKNRSRGILAQDSGGQPGVEVLEIAGELGKAQIDQPVGADLSGISCLSQWFNERSSRPRRLLITC